MRARNRHSRIFEIKVQVVNTLVTGMGMYVDQGKIS